MNYNFFSNKININDFFDVDWTKRPNIFFLIILFAISRIPLLNLGFGSDPDAWRIANSAFDLHYFNIYHPSRFPGYPLPEFFNSLIINYGWLATNILTMILSLISVIVFANILKELNIKNKGLIVITYAFIPILWINSASTMDYMWALAFIIFTWFFIIKKQHYLAGLMMGLAIGSRITSAALILPFIYLILVDSKNAKNAIYFFLIATVTAIILFLPLFFQYNLEFLTYYPMSIDMIMVWQNINHFFGIFAVSFGLMLFILSSKSLLNNIVKRDKLTLFLLFSIGLIFILFIKAPYDTAYLIPAIPFLLLLMNKISKKKFFAIFCFLLMLNSFVSFASSDISSIVQEGVVLEDIELRNNLVHSTQTILNNNNRNSVVIVGEYLPSLCYMYEESAKNHKLIGMVGFNKLEIKEHWDSKNNVGYIYLASKGQLLDIQRKNFKTYYGGSNPLLMTEQIYKYNLEDYNCSNILI